MNLIQLPVRNLRSAPSAAPLRPGLFLCILVVVGVSPFAACGRKPPEKPADEPRRTATAATPRPAARGFQPDGARASADRTEPTNRPAPATAPARTHTFAPPAASSIAPQNAVQQARQLLAKDLIEAHRTVNPTTGEENIDIPEDAFRRAVELYGSGVSSAPREAAEALGDPDMPSMARDEMLREFVRESLKEGVGEAARRVRSLGEIDSDLVDLGSWQIARELVSQNSPSTVPAILVSYGLFSPEEAKQVVGAITRGTD